MKIDSEFFFPILLMLISGLFIYLTALFFIERGKKSEYTLDAGQYEWDMWIIHMLKMPVYTILLWLVFFSIISLLDLIFSSFINWLTL